MSEMVLLTGKVGSKVANVACPQCGRISRQILKAEYQSQPQSELYSIHVCPICGAKYNLAVVSNKAAWLTVLFNRLAIGEEELTFQRPIDKDSDIRTFSMISLLETLAYPIPVHVGDIKTAGSLLERKLALNNLRSKSKLARDEQGTNILYLSFGFIEWRENNSSNAVWLKSPVLMMPVSLKLESVRAPFTISRYDDDIEVNPTLDYLFNERYGVDLPTFELNGEESIGQYMKMLEEIADHQGWKLIREVSLGLLSFLKISMYHDLNSGGFSRRYKSAFCFRKGRRTSGRLQTAFRGGAKRFLPCLT